MYDYLSTITPDSTATFSLACQGILIEECPCDEMVINKGYGSSEEVIILSSVKMYYVTIQYNAISRSDSGIIFDLYNDPAKANKIARSFKWQHPTDGHTYVVKFRGNLSRFKQNAEIYGFSTMQLMVIGRIAD